jgi:small subunit ribosomal protein S17e
MGRVRTKTVKKSAKVIIERYYPKLSLDFETNKRICDEVRNTAPGCARDNWD